jgi:glutamyl-tRNA synthetase
MPASELADLMFPGQPETPQHWEARYAERDLPQGAWVTRFAPSPTGYLHTGGLYAAIIAQDLAHNSGGVYFVRIENTDAARELEDARRQFGTAFDYFSIHSDEADDAPWGPYEQRKRAPIYESFARELVAQGKAYPCFCTPEDLAALTARQQAAKVPPGYYGEWAACRHLDPAEAERRVREGVPYAIRFRAPDGPADRVAFDDMIRGRIEQLDNRNDAVILKRSDQDPRLPTYHFAHAVDDHLMRVNLITRGEEWIPSVPLHLQLFDALGFTPPSYAHIAPLMKLEGSSKRKLSKRKDPEATVELYMTQGYPAEAVRIYLRGLANSNLADVDFAEAAATPIRLDRMGVAGPVFDSVKLDSISRNYVAELSPADRLAALEAWARQFDPDLAALLERDHEFALRAFELEGALTENPRKDVAKWADFLGAYGAYLPSHFEPVTDPTRPELEPTPPDVVRAVAKDFADHYVDAEEKDVWFEQVRAVASRNGFAPTMGEFKREPDKFVGPLSQAANVIRVALTGQRHSADLFLIARVIGKDETLRRLRALAG